MYPCVLVSPVPIILPREDNLTSVENTRTDSRRHLASTCCIKGVYKRHVSVVIRYFILLVYILLGEEKEVILQSGNLTL